MSTPHNDVRPRLVTEGDTRNTGGRSTLSVPQSSGLRPAVVAAEADALTAPCRRCGHVLSAPRSVSRGLGPVCVHLVGAGGEGL